jgi:hypothetical protein
MHSTCLDNLPKLSDYVECKEPFATSHTFEGTFYPDADALAFFDRVKRESDRQLFDQVDKALESITDFESPEKLRLMVGNEEDAQAIREYLVEHGHSTIEVKVAAPLSTSQRGNYQWTPAMSDAKAAAWDAQQPRHSSAFTKSQSSPKARKAARRRAKAGRKAAR